MTGVTVPGSGMLTDGASGACCIGVAVSGTLCGADSPVSAGDAVALVRGAESGVSIDFPWGTVVAVFGTVSGANTCESGVDEMTVLVLALSLFGGVW